MSGRKLDMIVFGGSAGALEPLMQILGALPADVHAPIAVVLHVMPRGPSLVPTILARVSSRRVVEPEDKEVIQPDTIYVAPPNYHMLIETHRSIALSVDDPVQFSRPSIDVLFHSAADAYGSQLAAVVLSGSNSDGAEGLARVVAGGGVGIVQAEDTAQYKVMPHEARVSAPGALALAPAAIAGYLGRGAA